MPSRPLALVDYSDDSDSDSGDIAAPPPKKPKTAGQSGNCVGPTTQISSLPPLPPRFHDLYAVPPRIGNSDDPALHGGRKRSIPHVQGNWPTHVFIEWHLTRPEFEILNDIYKTATREASALNHNFKLETHLSSDLGTELPLHLSLSRPNVLTTGQKEGFLDMLKDRIGKTRVAPFPVQFFDYEWVRNHDGTRWFFVLKATRGQNDELPCLLQVVNRTFPAFGQPPLYSPGGDGMDGFHVSLAWSLTEPPAQSIQRIRNALTHAEKSGGKDKCSCLKMEVAAVRVKIGNVVHIINLKAKEPLTDDGERIVAASAS